jgi:hypothetical protein
VHRFHGDSPLKWGPPSPEDRPQSEFEPAAGDVNILSSSADSFGPSGIPWLAKIY